MYSIEIENEDTLTRHDKRHNLDQKIQKILILYDSVLNVVIVTMVPDWQVIKAVIRD